MMVVGDRVGRHAKLADSLLILHEMFGLSGIRVSLLPVACDPFKIERECVRVRVSLDNFDIVWLPCLVALWWPLL